MRLDSTTAISALDGRYRNKVSALAEFTSEYGLIRYRVHVECEWLLWLAAQPAITELAPFSASDRAVVRAIASNFTPAHAAEVKAFEATTNHDVKAVEYFVKAALQKHPSLQPLLEWVHFACTSEDINNLSYALMLRDARDQVLIPLMSTVIRDVEALATEHADLAMLSRTHGQGASPTTLGKEMKNVAVRLVRQRDQAGNVLLLGKINGAVGNFNAHVSAYPDADWPQISAAFVEHLGLTNNPHTTQIEPHDFIAELFHALLRFNTVLLDFDRDMWSYIAIDYFSQRKVEGETGSSTMPHKVNPIDFENSEGNLGIANALLEHMAAKLPVSRWQRDLTDSTVLRNIGTVFGHCAVAYQATVKGLSRLDVNTATLARDLDQSWEVLGEAVQTVMRKYGLSEPYERLKAATRGQQMNATLFAQVLDELGLPPAARAELAGLTPASYTGVAGALARRNH